MSIKPPKIVKVVDVDKASGANPHASKAAIVQTKEGVRTSMGKGVSLNQKSGKSARGK